MRQHIKGIDHAFILVRNLDSARVTFTRLGFTTSPLGRHSANRGTGNHTIMLEKDYFELLGVLERTELSQRWLDVVKAREGLTAIALRTEDAAATATELRAIGIAAGVPETFSRPVELPDGTRDDARFTTLRIPEGAVPDRALFFCQHLTPQNTWIPSLMQHANTAYGIDHVAVATETPRPYAEASARLFGTMQEEIAAGTARVETGSAPILYMTPSAIAARYAGADLSGVAATGPAVLSVKVRDAGKAELCLREAGVDFAVTQEGLLVRPQEACGVLLVLRAA